MVNRCRHVSLPSWVKTADRERLIEHMQYLTSRLETERKALSKARYRYRKAEKELKEIKENDIPKPLLE